MNTATPPTHTPIVDEPLPVDAKRVQPNPLGTKKGYNPYDSGRLSRDAAKKPVKKDLRRLGEWLKSKNDAGGNKD